MRFGGAYVKQSDAEYTEQMRVKLEQSLHRRARELGYEVVKKPTPDECDTPLSL
jgi:hypothetical protein